MRNFNWRRTGIKGAVRRGETGFWTMRLMAYFIWIREEIIYIALDERGLADPGTAHNHNLDSILLDAWRSFGRRSFARLIRNNKQVDACKSNKRKLSIKTEEQRAAANTKSRRILPSGKFEAIKFQKLIFYANFNQLMRELLNSRGRVRKRALE